MAPAFLSTVSPAAAAERLRVGGLVGLPTETVYGLAARADHSDAVLRIFDVKGRPSSNPLIVHVADQSALSVWATDIPGYVWDLADRFWPGPLTLVLTSNGRACPQVQAGQPTIALRAPQHPLFQAVLARLQATGVPSPGLAAPSANRSGRVSPTTAPAVAAELGSALSSHDAILDGGPCTVGIESTIIVCGTNTVSIARPGSISLEQIAQVVDVTNSSSSGTLPGSSTSHYAPVARVRVVDSIDTVGMAANGAAVGVIGIDADISEADPTWRRLTSARTPEVLAQQLYAALRSADEHGLDEVVAVVPNGVGISLAIRDRLTRSAAARTS